MGPNWLRGRWPFLLYKVLYNTHASPRGPCVAIQLYSAIQRYTLYSYTSLYSIHYTTYATPLWVAQGEGVRLVREVPKYMWTLIGWVL